jgi:hypothetical protein
VKARLEPFGLAGGRLLLDGVDLGSLAEGLQGRPAWVISGRAVLAAYARARGRRRALVVEVGGVGPPPVLTLLSQAGAWAGVVSGHELALALKAGFPAQRLLVRAPVLDDGLILEALSARVAMLARAGADESLRVTRIARSLKLPVPKASGAPPLLPAPAFARCGGLLARLLAGPPALVLDALWEAPAGTAVQVLTLAATSFGSGRRATLAALASTRRAPAQLFGEPARGDWVLVPDPAALAVRPPHPAWPLPRTVLVHGGLWRELDARPMPPSD